MQFRILSHGQSLLIEIEHGLIHIQEIDWLHYTALSSFLYFLSKRRLSLECFLYLRRCLAHLRWLTLTLESRFARALLLRRFRFLILFALCVSDGRWRLFFGCLSWQVLCLGGHGLGELRTSWGQGRWNKFVGFNAALHWLVVVGVRLAICHLLQFFLCDGYFGLILVTHFVTDF